MKERPVMIDMHVFSAAQLTKLAYAWSNISKDQLEKAGVMKPNQVGGSDWKRFNADPMMFIIKLPKDQLDALCRVLNR